MAPVIGLLANPTTLIEDQGISGSKDVFFDFVAANPLGLDHVQKQGNQYRFEDLRGGDLDFNDAVFTVRTMVA